MALASCRPWWFMSDRSTSMTSRSHLHQGVDPIEDRTGRAGLLGDQLCFALYAATNAMTRAYRPLLGELGLTYPQYLVLLVLWEHRSCRLGRIAEELHLATHAVSPIVDRLEDAGLVRRMADGEDRRAVRVELTEAGSALESSAAEVQEAMRCRTSLDPESVVELRSDLLALVEQLLEG